jgi:hypothetical protein
MFGATINPAREITCRHSVGPQIALQLRNRSSPHRSGTRTAAPRVPGRRAPITATRAIGAALSRAS